MSWAEVYKINSDFDEPLNFTNYIYDISVFGANSYVLQPMNVKIWNSLSKDSMYLYGHNAIHSIVYNALSTTNVDNLWNLSGKCGRQLNAFYQINLFNTESGLEVVKHMTMTAFNYLEQKLIDGYDRYLTQFLNKTTGVGAWINSTFSLGNATLAGLNTIDSVIVNTAAMVAICQNEAAIIALTNCTYSSNKIASNTTASTLITNNCISSLTVNALINNIHFITPASQNQTVMHLMMNNQAAMNSLISSSIALTPILNSSIALNEIANSTLALNTLFTAWSNISIGGDALLNSQSAIGTLQNSLPNIINGNTVSNLVNNAHDLLTSVINTVTPIMLNMANIGNFVNTWINNATAMNAIASSTTAMNAVTSSALALNACLKSDVARSAFCTHNDVLQACYENIYTTINNTTYFTKTYSYIDSGYKRANATTTDAVATPNQSIYVCKKIGSWSNGSSATGSIYHLQNLTNIVASHTGTLGAGENVDDFVTGGYQMKYICIGGARFIESGDAYTSGYFCYAK